MSDKRTTNGYVLPSGEVVSLPDHCADTIERFTLRDGSIVWAVKVVDDDEATAHNLARKLPAPVQKPR